MSSKPIGSGRFAMSAGIVFLASALAVWLLDAFGDQLGIQVRPIYVLIGWLFASGLMAVIWGQNRIKDADPNDHRIGMDTINMIVTMLGVTFAVAALVVR